MTPKALCRTLSVLLVGMIVCNGAAGSPANPIRSRAVNDSARVANTAGAGLTLNERIACLQALEEVYRGHRIWPAGNGPKPPLTQLMPQAALRQKVEDSLRKSQALAEYWHRPLGPKELQAEMNRMARQTRDAGRLRELWGALGNDPYMIAECLVRPALADRLIRNWYASGDQSGEPRGRDFGVWWVSTRQALRGEIIEDRHADYRLPTVAAGKSDCAADTWTNTSAGYPEGREHHRVVWTGAEMIVWGGASASGAMAGHRYDPATDTWAPTSEDGAPNRRTNGHSAVWTGAEMIVWGGHDGITGLLDTGGRYNPSSDTWILMNRTGAPSRRGEHTAVWTGSQMIIWGGGGTEGPVGTGGRYDLDTDTWTPTSEKEAPVARAGHAAVWTGVEMIVWGGNNRDFLNTGGRYNPATDTWIPTNPDGAPVGRSYFTAVWAGGELIIWGGARVYRDPEFFNSGGRYNPVTDSWTPTNLDGAPSARWGHTGIWTGTEMVVWGGGQLGYHLNDGARYDPSSDTWRATSVVNAPRGRGWHTATWTGTEMIVWSGIEGNLSFAERLRTGGRYHPVSDSWVPTAESGAPTGRQQQSAIWTGSEMIVWGGTQFSGSVASGGRYDPATDTFVATSQDGAPIGRDGHTVVWTGTEMIVWGGRSRQGSGGRYNPASDTWVRTAEIDAPNGREGHTAVWTGTEMIVWGGRNGYYPDDNLGYRYNPATDAWRITSPKAAPEARYGHTAIWTGNEMIVWAGHGDLSLLASGGRYDPSTDAWTTISEEGAGPVRTGHTAIWTGTEMIAWGGFTGEVGYLTPINTGRRYDLAANRWSDTSQDGAPSIRLGYTVVWTGNDMIVWGGQSETFPLNTGYLYNPATDNWAATSQYGAPGARANHSAVWTGTEMIVWGGSNFPFFFDVGGRYCARTGSNR